MAEDRHGEGQVSDTIQEAGRASHSTVACRNRVVEESSKSTQSCRVQLDAHISASATSFASDVIRRGMPVSTALRKHGKIFENNVGDASAYALSQPCRCISEFISHNWSTDRWKKFCVLALHFNLHYSIVVALLSIGAVASLVGAGVLPVGRTAAGVVSLWSLVASWVFLPSLFYFREIFSRFGFSEPLTFLDKTCIHQTDQKLKQQGIESLGAFLASSKRIVIVYNEAYLRRLWTVYELATILTINSDCKVRLVPLELPRVLFVLGSIQSLAGLCICISNLANLPAFKIILMNLAIILIAFFAFPMARLWAKVVQDIATTLGEFDIRVAQCYCESDREVVKHNVAAFVRMARYVDENASDDEALEAFNGLVREEIPVKLASAMSGTGISYGQALVVSLPMVAVYAEDAATNVVWHEYLVYRLSQILATTPLALAMLFWLAARLPYSSKCQKVLANVVAVFCFWGLNMLTVIPGIVLKRDVIMLPSGVVQLFIALYVFLPRECCGRRRQRSSSILRLPTENDAAASITKEDSCDGTDLPEQFLEFLAGDIAVCDPFTCAVSS